MPEKEQTALKEWFNADRFRHIAGQLKEIYPRFDGEKFLLHTTPLLEPLSLMARMRLMAETLYECLPADYPQALEVMRKLAPRIEHNFVTLVLPDFVGLYGLERFDLSMDALKYFTTFGSSEFAVRKFIRHDQKRALKIMGQWSRDPDEAVRRLASEGSRPRLPWSFKLDELIAEPSPVDPILENLKADPSLYVRKSVGNHLNDITKDNPDWVMRKLRSWDLKEPRTSWIAKRALRSLIKEGNQEALELIGVSNETKIKVKEFKVTPARIKLGEALNLDFSLRSTSANEQFLVIDYTIFYVKKSGECSGKVFKWKEVLLRAGEELKIQKKQQIRNFTTRVHHPGKHELEITVNGKVLAKGSFILDC